MHLSSREMKLFQLMCYYLTALCFVLLFASIGIGYNYSVMDISHCQTALSSLRYRNSGNSFNAKPLNETFEKRFPSYYDSSDLGNCMTHENGWVSQFQFLIYPNSANVTNLEGLSLAKKFVPVKRTDLAYRFIIFVSFAIVIHYVVTLSVCLPVCERSPCPTNNRN